MGRAKNSTLLVNTPLPLTLGWGIIEQHHLKKIGRKIMIITLTTLIYTLLLAGVLALRLPPIFAKEIVLETKRVKLNKLKDKINQ